MTSGQPYLSLSREDIHQHDGSINNKSESGSDKEAGLPHPGSESDIDTDEDTTGVRNYLVTIETFYKSIHKEPPEVKNPSRTIQPLCEVSPPVRTRFTLTTIHILLLPATQHSSIATLSMP